VAPHNGKLYIIGGETSSGTYSSKVYTFDGSSNPVSLDSTFDREPASDITGREMNVNGFSRIVTFGGKGPNGPDIPVEVLRD
jgi:hypothetical protein